MEILYKPKKVKLKPQGKGQLLIVKSDPMSSVFLAKELQAISLVSRETSRVLDFKLISKHGHDIRVSLNGCVFIQESDELRFYFNNYQEDFKFDGVIHSLIRKLNSSNYILIYYDNRHSTLRYDGSIWSYSNDIISNDLYPNSISNSVTNRQELFEELNTIGNKIIEKLNELGWK